MTILDLKVAFEDLNRAKNHVYRILYHPYDGKKLAALWDQHVPVYGVKPKTLSNYLGSVRIVPNPAAGPGEILLVRPRELTGTRLKQPRFEILQTLKLYEAERKEEDGGGEQQEKREDRARPNPPVARRRRRIPGKRVRRPKRRRDKFTRRLLR